ncbi:enoyl-CoA hydratase/isomerase family protein [Cobetia amphilecti]|uniref:enoyl-CoA hydratase/isomerase family protein n=1 Tax=Cobetia amphilecti TaxID=1055104 RepID=UPI001CDAB5AD|nr:enoyl-CoA hydratase/isomerase family protein [Cobetia amphilecti]UBU47853.1 enoyl-CoA hydratase/isomerase family protein [Cobetia amphilecti]
MSQIEGVTAKAATDIEAPVVFETRRARDGKQLGIMRLNAPRSLNALSLAMIERIEAQLDAWELDSSIAMVWLEGAGERALCAGGDIVALYQAMTTAPASEGADPLEALDDFFATRYFTAEYRLDHRLHTFPKPLLVWGGGIVMGGGMGLFAGGCERVVTESSRLAMPEVSIGLYPDVGASWLLNRLPRGIGEYLGATGAQLNARDALDLGLATRLIPDEQREALKQALCEGEFGRHPSRHLSQVLSEFERRELAPPGQVLPLFDHLQQLVAGREVQKACQRIIDDPQARSDCNAWLSANRERLLAGCPSSPHLVFRMLGRHRHSSLAEAFRDELTLSVRCCMGTELAEGVRALLIDKDKQPQWAYASIAQVSEEYIDGFFAPLWEEDEHPLMDL